MSTTAKRPKVRSTVPYLCRQGPQPVSHGVCYYERRDYIEVQLTNLFGMPVIGRIPWADLIASARRCRPEEFPTPNS